MCFRGKVKKTQITVYEELTKLLILIVPGEDVLSAMKELGFSVEVLWLIQHPYQSIQNGNISKRIKENNQETWSLEVSSS